MTLVERIRNAIMLKAEEFDADDLCCMGAPTSQHGRNVATALARATIEAMPLRQIERMIEDHLNNATSRTHLSLLQDIHTLISTELLAAALKEKA